MNIKELHTETKAVSTKPLFKGELGSVLALQIMKDEQFPEHITKTPALLLCVKGHVFFRNVNGFEEELQAGDYINVEPMIRHWVDAVADSDLVLIK